MRQISLMMDLQIVEGSIEDYRRLSAYHYRDCRLGPYSDIFAIKGVGKLGTKMRGSPAGVIVYSMPPAGLELRNIALGGILNGMDMDSRFRFINKNIRTISRVIIEPRFRSIGLAEKLVRETMERVEVPVIEALAVMGKVNNFFERAGMTAYEGPVQKRCVKMIEAFDFAGISEKDLIDAEVVQKKIETLPPDLQGLIDKQMVRFLQCYGKRRKMQPGIERTRFVLSRLGARPIYYIKIKHQKSNIKMVEPLARGDIKIKYQKSKLWSPPLAGEKK